MSNTKSFSIVFFKTKENGDLMFSNDINPAIFDPDMTLDQVITRCDELEADGSIIYAVRNFEIEPENTTSSVDIFMITETNKVYTDKVKKFFGADS